MYHRMFTGCWQRQMDIVLTVCLQRHQVSNEGKGQMWTGCWHGNINAHLKEIGALKPHSAETSAHSRQALQTNRTSALLLALLVRRCKRAAVACGVTAAISNRQLKVRQLQSQPCDTTSGERNSRTIRTLPQKFGRTAQCRSVARERESEKLCGLWHSQEVRHAPAWHAPAKCTSLKYCVCWRHA